MIHLVMKGQKLFERKDLLKNVDKIIFITKWVKKDFLKICQVI